MGAAASPWAVGIYPAVLRMRCFTQYLLLAIVQKVVAQHGYIKYKGSLACMHRLVEQSDVRASFPRGPTQLHVRWLIQRSIPRSPARRMPAGRAAGTAKLAAVGNFMPHQTGSSGHWTASLLIASSKPNARPMEFSDKTVSDKLYESWDRRTTTTVALYLTP